MKVLFKNARILTMADENIIRGDLLVIDMRIAYIGNDASAYAPFDQIIDCQNQIIMPGLKNAHAHSAMVFLRNRGKDLNLQDWLFKFVFPREEKLIPSDIYHLNKVAYLEYVRNGITAIFDHYFFPLEAAKSAEDFGMRTLLLATCNPGKVTIDDIEKNYHLLNSKKDGLVRYIDGFHAEYTADDLLLEETKEAINRLKCPFYTHISETKKEVEECITRHNMPPLKFLFENGLFKYGGGGYHCVHLTDEEIKICKEHHLNIVSCPGSNLYLSSGKAPLDKYLKEGINIALGTDGPASNEGLDMFREMRLASLTEEGNHLPNFEVLKMATVNAAKAMYLDDSDILAVNKYADIIMLNLPESNDVIGDIVNNGQIENVTLTMINGKIIYNQGKYYINESIDDIYKKADEIAARIEREL